MTDPTPAPNVEKLRATIVDRYSRLARQAMAGQIPTDSRTTGGQDGLGAARYEHDETIPAPAVRAGLGCGNPVAVADITPGETVLDLGSGGGLDVILSARRTGPEGKAYGLDASTDMLILARANAEAAGAANAEFLHGHIEDIPLPDAHVDVAISNCVINLSADKPRVLTETFRVLRPGGRLAVSDVIAEENLDDAERAEAERQVGCALGTVTAVGYRDLLLAAGFTTATVTPTHQVAPGLTSATIHATKPAAPEGVSIRLMCAADADQVLAIYQAGLDGGNASFETSAPAWEVFDAAKLPRHRHVAIDTTTGQVLGWVAASAVSDRCVYAGVVEHSLYIHPDHHGRGIATALLHALIGSTETAGIWTIQSGVFPENAASLAMHAKAGFHPVGTRQRIGRHHDRWRDVILIERRSTTAGTS